MSIASEITRLSGVRSDIFTSITNKGVTVPATATFSSCPALIDSITGGGGGGEPTSLINDSFTASGYLSAYRPFTATQNVVPLYDVVTGTYTTGAKDNYYYYIEIPMEVLTGGITGYSLNFGIQSYHFDNNYIGLSPNLNDFYTYAFYTEINGKDFITSGSFDPTLYVCTIDNNNFSTWWSKIRQQSWFLNAFTGNTFLLTFYNPHVSTVIGDYTQMTQTGTDVSYPTYPTTTTGYVINTVSSQEYWDNGRAKLSANVIRNFVYDDSPSDETTNNNSTANITTFSSNVMKNWDGTYINLNGNDSNYTYSYGTSASGYSGFEGV